MMSHKWSLYGSEKSFGHSRRDRGDEIQPPKLFPCGPLPSASARTRDRAGEGGRQGLQPRMLWEGTLWSLRVASPPCEIRKVEDPDTESVTVKGHDSRTGQFSREPQTLAALEPCPSYCSQLASLSLLGAWGMY